MHVISLPLVVVVVAGSGATIGGVIAVIRHFINRT